MRRAKTPPRRVNSGGLIVPLVVVTTVLVGVVALVAGVRSPDGGTSVQSVPSPPTASERFPNQWPDPPAQDVALLLDGLGPGAMLDARWRVRGVSPVHDGRVVVDVDDGSLGFRVEIRRKGEGKFLPPASTERYALFTIQPRPTLEAVSDEDYREVLSALAARLRKTEGRVPTPRGL